MREWKECKLGDVALIVDCEHKTAPLVKSSGYISVRTTDISNGRINYDIANRVSEHIYTQWTKRIIPNEGDIVLAREAPVGEVGWVDNKHKICLGQRTVLIRSESKDVYPRYLLYYFVNNEVKYELISQATGSVVQHLNVRNIREFNIKIHNSLPEQRAIASVLSSLDDKIDLLHRQNKTLEAMAETLFRQWFVEEADEGWEEGKLGDVLELIYGKGLKEEIRAGTGFPVVGSSGIIGYHSEFLVEAPGIVIGRKGTIGKVIYLYKKFFPIDTTYYVKSKLNSVGLFYEYFLLKTLNLEELNSDSAVPGLNRVIALSTEIKMPPIKRLHDFNQEISILFERIEINNKQIRTLEKLRDTLLPKLMSGEVRVNV